MSTDNLKSIKSRMGWQVGLQAATLLAVGGVSGSVRDQTEVIRDSLETLQNETIEGFSSVNDAINSLEASLISGIESINVKVGLVDSITQGFNYGYWILYIFNTQSNLK